MIARRLHSDNFVLPLTRSAPVLGATAEGKAGQNYPDVFIVRNEESGT